MFSKKNIKLLTVLERSQKIRLSYFALFVIIIMFLETFSFGMFYFGNEEECNIRANDENIFE